MTVFSHKKAHKITKQSFVLYVPFVAKELSLVAGGDNELRRKFHLVRGKEFLHCLFDFNGDLGLLVRRQRRQFFSQRVRGL